MKFAFYARVAALAGRPGHSVRRLARRRGAPAPLAAALAVLVAAWAAWSPEAARAAEPLAVPIVYLTVGEKEPPPLSLVEPIITDKGLAGARLGIADNNTTGRFLNQSYALTEVIAPDDKALAARVVALLAEGKRYFVADLHADQLLAVADLPGAKDALFFNIRAQDDRLRTDDCRSNVLQVMPSRAMKADALAQYLMKKRWSHWFLVDGQQPDDLAFVKAVHRAAKRFGAEIVEERPYSYKPEARRSDTGYMQIQGQMTQLTQEVDDYDVLVVSDESDIFGEYLPYRTWDPRPVVGTQGLVPTAWHRSMEQWGGTQLQNRFIASAGHVMVERDYNGWVAVRSVGEAVTRTGQADPASVHAYLVGDEFRLGAFKGEGLTYRRWNQQLRQPILLSSARMLVSVSPQDGYLHQRTPLDTLGYDEPESRCRLN
ncbi:amino acid/amide ABC transporter substrate-binding protein, HAAT family [Tistlia consotensis]|uniref:Amino acid/amide ABC transporter substrate-binding protein, HAAT family n=1 Tax=Tistlia consotensis USBA 355 TaxID=560819 RepID=A0A1Y6CG30_9PROT|nr:ABC transporter substrate-binding protein [Tistlia consotensis]SMF60035.1 amino acid/amide ABC transporter substrate-binding protein, HAAT family [Tistlia consotensis USBA 355]SNR94068.1 amino acid/amide ABC transporter substrate-binding protein, HAAT family [Tistlia consotensis]